jgi:arylsulfatase A-like enzyme
MNSFENYNLILINLDGLRRDKLDLSPVLANIKKTCYFFNRMNTVAPYTFASLHAIFSGTYPSKNGVNGYYNILKFKDSEMTTISSVLQHAGYYTCCDIIDKSVIPRQGFDEYNIFEEQSVNFTERHSLLLKNLAKKNKKFFVFLHYTETHKQLVRKIVEKYDPKSNDDAYFNSREENERRYESHIPLCDEYLKTLLKTLTETGILDNTILLIFSDHGTSLGEKKGEKFYGVYVYDYTIEVFTMLKIPHMTPKVIDTQCRTIDIFPTLVEIAGLDVNQIKQIQGQSLLNLTEDPSQPDREVFVETGGLYGFWPSPNKPNVFCIKINDKKLIYNDTPMTWEFYDLKQDPSELQNMYDANSPQVQFLKSRLLHYLKENKIQTNITP